MIPNYFSKAEIPDKLPKEMGKLVEVLKKSKDKEDCLKRTYQYLTKKYRGYKLKTLIKFSDVSVLDIEKIWAKSGFLPCTTFNYLLRILLIKSGFFIESDIEIKRTVTYHISPHQYLRIRINDKKYINVDLWGQVYDIKFGDHAHGFHMTSGR